MFDPELKGVLELSKLRLDETGSARRSAVGNAFMVNGLSYLPLDARPMVDLEMEFQSAILRNRQLCGSDLLRNNLSYADASLIAETNETIARLALMTGKDYSYANALDLLGTAYLEMAIHMYAEKGTTFSSPIFAKARDARLRAARVCYLLAEERTGEARDLWRHTARHLNFVGSIDVKHGDFAEGIKVKLGLLKGLEGLYRKTNDTTCLDLLLSRLSNLSRDYLEADMFAESVAVSCSRAKLLVELGRIEDAASEYWFTYNNLNKRLDGSATREILLLQKTCLEQSMALSHQLGYKGREKAARELLAVVNGNLIETTITQTMQ